jgi:CRISPR system Cascade subunit CasE
MWLSMLPLNHRSRQVQAELRNPYEMHRTLSYGFGDGEGEFAAARCLFRVDASPSGQELAVLVQSLTEPEWSKLESKPGYLTAAPVTKAFEPRFAPGQRLAFRLVANPSVKHEGRRLGLYREEETIAWMERKAAENGFDLARLVSRPPERIRCTTAGGQPATLASVRFDGVLVVRDPERLVAAIQSGIGSAKGFGFGLLSLARV